MMMMMMMMNNGCGMTHDEDEKNRYPTYFDIHVHNKMSIEFC